jgi:nucleoid-associated protein YgaU
MREAKMEVYPATEMGPAWATRSENVAKVTVRRWLAAKEALPEGRSYKPKILRAVSDAISSLPAADFQREEGPVLAEHTVKRGETLSMIAVLYYGKGQAGRWREIYAANKDVLDDPDDLFQQQVIRIPELPKGESASAVQSAALGIENE